MHYLIILIWLAVSTAWAFFKLLLTISIVGFTLIVHEWG